MNCGKFQVKCNKYPFIAIKYRNEMTAMEKKQSLRKKKSYVKYVTNHS